MSLSTMSVVSEPLPWVLDDHDLIAVASLGRGPTNLGSANDPFASTAGDVGMRKSPPNLIPAKSISSTSTLSTIITLVAICYLATFIPGFHSTVFTHTPYSPYLRGDIQTWPKHWPKSSECSNYPNSWPTTPPSGSRFLSGWFRFSISWTMSARLSARHSSQSQTLLVLV